MPRCQLARLVMGPVVATSLAIVPAVSPASAAPSNAALTAQVNRVRVAHGLPKLRLVARLSAAAQRHSAAQARSGSLNHNGFAQRIRGAGIKNIRVAGENVAAVSGCGAPAASRIIRAWMKSGPHRRNLLSPSFRWMGVGLAARGGCGVTYATVEFAG